MNIILGSLNSIYVQFKKFIHENLSILKKLYVQNEDIINWGNEKDVKNKLIEDFYIRKGNIKNVFNNMKERIINMINEINTLKINIENSINESPFLNKNPLVCKFILELPNKIRVIESYINLLENEIKNIKYNNLDMINNMLNISMETNKLEI